ASAARLDPVPPVPLWADAQPARNPRASKMAAKAVACRLGEGCMVPPRNAHHTVRRGGGGMVGYNATPIKAPPTRSWHEIGEGSGDAIRDASGEILYRQCETSVHHHHLTCRNCGRSVEVEGRAVEQWAEKVAAEAGFTDVGHTVELFGLCPQCAAG